MFMKHVAAAMLVSGIFCATTQGKACVIKKVKANSYKQARTLIDKYNAAKDVEKKQCIKEMMSDLLMRLKKQNNVFGGAMKDEAMSGELEASIINEQEQVDLKRTIALLEDTLAEIDSTMPATQKRDLASEADDRVSNKRRRVIN